MKTASSKRREYKKACDAFCEARFENYQGKNRFEVRHPAHPATVVAAPDENSAMVAAAEHNGLRWTDYSYYAYAEVTKAEVTKQ